MPVKQLYDTAIVEQLKKAIRNIRPWVLTNMAREERDNNAGRIIQLVSEKYLTIQARQLGAVDYDASIERMVSQMRAVSKLGIKALRAPMRTTSSIGSCKGESPTIA